MASSTPNILQPSIETHDTLPLEDNEVDPVENTITNWETNPTTDPIAPVQRPQRERRAPQHLDDYVCTMPTSLQPTKAPLQSTNSAISSIDEPKTFSQAIKHEKWREAMRNEITALEKNGTWTIETLPPGKRAIDSKWVYKVKFKPDGTVERYKARLVAKGFTQIEGLDFHETFAPVTKMVTVRVLLALASIKQWELHQLDVNNAFLQGDLHEEANPHIIHRDIKASNVLLDINFQAKVADFGFAKLIPDGVTHLTTRVKGTLGYLAPEYAMWGKVSDSCDVYSFGILLLEIISAKKPLEKLPGGVKRDIVQWVRPYVQKGAFDHIADPRLKGKFDRAQLKSTVMIALRCVDGDPDNRPTMREVVECLKGGVGRRKKGMGYVKDMVGEEDDGENGDDTYFEVSKKEEYDLKRTKSRSKRK
ncbi:hypothetical protein SLEP1_g6297 [Rubroshorea leprosula]|uniref:Protein kinase domain-containing protein n=1 Tax=Rubroshorea leprosula TaxID=152421 RepID=A0AAV5I5F4_9ROSI|nr:hypothetical protein SLEP1_g6297 [Rubroshorea leprosula]